MIDPIRVPSALLPRRFRVIENYPELSDVSTLSILPVDGTQTAGQPGQFNMLYAFGVGEIAISISGNPADTDTMLHTIRKVGAVSVALCALREGAMLGLRGPFGTPWPLAEQAGRDLVFIAGGLGLAPLRPAILRALATRTDFRSISLLVGARSPSDLLYPAQLADWAGSGGLRLSLTVDRANPGWSGMVGVVTTRLERALEGCDPDNVSAMICGPEVMMRHCCLALSDAGVPPSAQWISMERNMKCATGSCGHCQFGPDFVCRDGPIFRWDRVAERLRIREI